MVERGTICVSMLIYRVTILEGENLQFTYRAEKKSSYVVW